MKDVYKCVGLIDDETVNFFANVHHTQLFIVCVGRVFRVGVVEFVLLFSCKYMLDASLFIIFESTGEEVQF